MLSRKVNLFVTDTKLDVGIKHFEAPYKRAIRYFKYSKSATGVFLNSFKLAFTTRSNIIIHEFAIGILSLPFMFLLCKLTRRKFFLWSHGYDRKKGFYPRRSILDMYRLVLMKLADGIIVYGQKDKLLLSKYVTPNKVFIAQNTLDTESLIVIKKQLQSEGRDNIKKRLGITHEYNIIFIGRMMKNKKPDLLYDIHNILLTKYNKRVGVHFVGDGPMMQEIKCKVEGSDAYNDFYFYGAVDDYEISGALLFVCDMMVMPGDLGLSINHSFCFDCPVTTFKQRGFSPAHGPEIEYLIHERTGFLIDEHTAHAISHQINSFFENSELRSEMIENVRNMPEDVFPITRMVDGLLNCINS